MSDIPKATAPRVIQVKNWKDNHYWREIRHNQFQEGERTVDICLNLRLAHHSVRTICVNPVRIKDSAQSGTKGYV